MASLLATPCRGGRCLCAALMLVSTTVHAGCTYRCQYKAPENRSSYGAWLKAIQEDREATLTTVHFTDGVFNQLAWTQTSYVQPQMHPYDLFFYDPETHLYTVERYLDDLQLRYGGIDAMLLWPTYTNIGIDDRNQFDYFRLMPGGLGSLTSLTSQLTARGVRVLWPYNPWDTGTRREGRSDEEVLVEMLKRTGGSGLNGDTMGYVPSSFWNAAVDAAYPIALQPEGGGSDAALNWATMGWGYWNLGSAAPWVDRFKFVSRGKFMTNVCDRWARRKTRHMQAAWFNGVGIETWENVWGTWNGIVPRDGEAIRRVATLLRFFGATQHGALLRSAEWEPHTPDAIQDGVHASKWVGENATLWTLVSASARALDGPQIYVDCDGPLHFYDCYHGTELVRDAPRLASRSLGDRRACTLSFPMEAVGYGCVVQRASAADAPLRDLLGRMARMTQGKPLAGFSDEWAFLSQTLVPNKRTPLASSAPKGTIYLPSNNYSFTVRGIEIEGGGGSGVDVQFPWETAPSRHHATTISIKPFYMDKYPVTNARYAEYLASTGYVPEDRRNWLAFWGENVSQSSPDPPASISNAPVTHVSLGEARAYCAWVNGGSRLPHSWEWQYAAQGTDGRRFPWGNLKNQSLYPKLLRGNTCTGPEDTTAHSPSGDSPFGVSDMVGNVWQYTDEFRDAHTRYVLLRGGSNYRPVVKSGTNWYFPNSIELDTHNKYMLFDDAYERAATVGFRCVVDAAA